MEMFSYKFDALRNLHDCANDLLRSPITQQALVKHRHEKWVDELCEGSLRMLDVCGITRDGLLLVKGHLQEFQSALRRRSIGDQSGMETRIRAYHVSIKKIMKKMLKCLEALKRMDGIFDPSPILDADPGLIEVVTVVRELRASTITVVESVLSFLSISKVKLRSRKRFFILNCMRGKRVANASEENYEAGLPGMNTALYVLSEHNWSTKSKVYGVSIASKHLEALESTTESFEVEFECMFRRLIEIRFSLLNIFNN